MRGLQSFPAPVVRNLFGASIVGTTRQSAKTRHQETIRGRSAPAFRLAKELVVNKAAPGSFGRGGNTKWLDPKGPATLTGVEPRHTSSARPGAGGGIPPPHPGLVPSQTFASDPA